ncbi:MAG: hypothetical protein K6F53_12425 [Lachnospiraceae bacterium]|nr:hypothetical protein [Lachnospiraceae bacterium]
MGVTDVLNANIGNIEKAVIEIIDARGRAPKKEGAVVPAGGGGGFLNLADTMLSKTGAASSLINQSLGNVAGKIAGFENRLKGASAKRFTVQFNPSSLSVRARGQGYMPTLAYGQNGATAEPAHQSVRVTVSVRLIFDQVDPFDAFMEDKTNLAPTNIGTGIAKTVNTARGKKTATVQQTVEGFIAALRSPYTRIITFHWGEMNYSGILNNVAAQYVMFNMQGQPIRAYMNLSLLHMDDTQDPDTLGAWEEAYKKAFSGDSLDTVKGFQSATNLINLG